MKNKNKEMLKTFFGVMRNREDSINLVIPNSYVESVYKIDYKALYQKGYHHIIFDIDNTILPVNDVNIPDTLVELFSSLKKMGFHICVVSNNQLERVKEPAERLGVSYLENAGKPNKSAFDKALKVLKSNIEDTVMVGDQMLSDIKGGNEYGLYTILVDPLEDKYDIKTGTSRILQNRMIKKLQKKNVFHIKHYYQ